MIDIQQVKKDFENGVLISRATWEKVIEAALAGNRRNTELQHVYNERGLQIERLEVAIKRASASDNK